MVATMQSVPFSDQHLPPRLEHVLADGRPLAFYESLRHGDDGNRLPTVFLIHGWGATAGLNWVTTFGALARDFHVIAPDMAGHGQSKASRSGFRLEQCADDVLRLADARGVERFIIAGYSMGGPISLLTAREAPDRVRGIVLCATAARFKHRIHEHAAFNYLKMFKEVAGSIPKGVYRFVARRISPLFVGTENLDQTWVRQELDGHSMRALVQAGAELGDFDATPWLHELNLPACVIVTTKDELVPPERQRELLADLVAANVGHVTSHKVDARHTTLIDDPERFVPTLIAACAQVHDAALQRIRNLASMQDEGYVGLGA
jgi:3-oxoadipate enol-lactonase